MTTALGISVLLLSIFLYSASLIEAASVSVQNPKSVDQKSITVENKQTESDVEVVVEKKTNPESKSEDAPIQGVSQPTAEIHQIIRKVNKATPTAAPTPTEVPTTVIKPTTAPSPEVAKAPEGIAGAFGSFYASVVSFFDRLF